MSREISDALTFSQALRSSSVLAVCYNLELVKTIEAIRRNNLKLLRDESGGVAKLATRLERSSSQVSQWLNASPDAKTGKPRTLNSASARYIETVYGLNEGWMDIDHSPDDSEAPEPPATPRTLDLKEPTADYDTRSGALTPEEMVLLEKYRKLSGKQRTAIQEVVDALDTTGKDGPQENQK